MAVYSLPAIIALIFKLALFAYAIRSPVRNEKTLLFLFLLAALSLFNLSEVFLLNYFPHFGVDSILEGAGYGYFAALIPAIAILLHLSLCLAHEGKKIDAKWLGLLYLPAAALEYLLLFTDTLVAGFRPFQFSIIRVPGPLYFLFETYFTLYLAAALVNLVAAARGAGRSSIARTRNRLWLIGLAPMALLMIYMIVSRHMNWPQLPSTFYVPIAQTFFLLVATYATYQYRLFDIEFYIPWSKVRKRKTAFYQRIHATVAELADLPSADMALDRVSALLRCPVALVGGWRPLLATAGDGAIEMAQFPHDELARIDRILVASEIKQAMPEAYRRMQQFRVAAVVPFYPHAKTAASWMLLGDAFNESVYTPLDFKNVERLFDSLGEFFLDKIAHLRQELAGAHSRIDALEAELDRLRKEQTVLRDFNFRLMLENHSLRAPSAAGNRGQKRERVVTLVPNTAASPGQRSLEAQVAQFEASLIAEALRRCKGNQSEAGRLLGLKPNTLHYKIKRYGLLSDKKGS